MLPYLVLLRVGFTLPPLLPAARCALTAPFHPYLCARCEHQGHRRSVFCGTFRRLSPPRCYLAPCPLEPGLSSTCLVRQNTQRLSSRLPRIVDAIPAQKCKHRNDPWQQRQTNRKDHWNSGTHRKKKRRWGAGLWFVIPTPISSWFLRVSQDTDMTRPIINQRPDPVFC